MHAVIEANRKALEELCRQYHVRSLSLFGSALDETFQPGKSDFDFAVEFEPLEPAEYAQIRNDLAAKLESLLGARVDLIEVDRVRNPYIRKDILATQRTLYAAAT